MNVIKDVHKYPTFSSDSTLDKLAISSIVPFGVDE